MVEYLKTIAQQLGVSLWLLIVILLWTATWKLLAMWKSARKGSIFWFVILAFFNTAGILPILYIFGFSKMKCCEFKQRNTKKKFN